MSTLMLLYIRHEGVDDLPVGVVAADYFGLSIAEFLKRAPRFGFSFVEARADTEDQHISLLELAKYIEMRREKAAREMNSFCGEAATGL